MALIVQKYGGTSVGSPERIKNVANRIAKFKAAGHDVVVVVSAMSGETNRLVALAEAMQEYPDPREMDVILATGEQVTIGLLAMALKNIGLDAKSYTGWQVAVTTDSSHTKARIEDIDADHIHADIKEGKVIIVAGFQGIDGNGDITTLANKPAFIALSCFAPLDSIPTDMLTIQIILWGSVEAYNINIKLLS